MLHLWSLCFLSKSILLQHNLAIQERLSKWFKSDFYNRYMEPLGNDIKSLPELPFILLNFCRNLSWSNIIINILSLCWKKTVFQITRWEVKVINRLWRRIKRKKTRFRLINILYIIQSTFSNKVALWKLVPCQVMMSLKSVSVLKGSWNFGCSWNVIK